MNKSRNRYKSKLLNLLPVCALLTALALSNVGNAIVSDEIAKGFRDLVDITVEQQKCPDPDKLALYFGSYGFDLLLPSHMDKIKNNFDVFAPIMVMAQEPGYRLSNTIQRFFRIHANRDQKQNMTSVLRDWITADYEMRHRGGHIVSPREAARRQINSARIEAAELLVEWDDREAIPLMHALIDSVKYDGELLWLAERAEMRFDDPCFRTFLYRESGYELGNCKTIESIITAQVHEAMSKTDSAIYTLSDEEVIEFWDMFYYSEFIENTQWGGGWHTIQIVFDDGVIATFCPSPTDQGIIVYKDNTSINRYRRRTLYSGMLHPWIWEILDREIGDEE